MDKNNLPVITKAVFGGLSSTEKSCKFNDDPCK